MKDLFNPYEQEKTCEYRGELYHVRDNGTIYRCRNKTKRKRPLDEKWTYGTPDKKHGYLNIADQRVHRIIATAFHGTPPSQEHVVDHIDTNRQNNRPENLRWVTRLENILINPITLNRIIHAYGSIDLFLEDPSKPLNGKKEQFINWMRPVTKEEAENTKHNLLNWSNNGKLNSNNELGDWIHSKHKKVAIQELDDSPYIESLTVNAIQLNWKTKSEFPCCPSTITQNTLAEYKHSLIKGNIFSINELWKSYVEEYEINETTKELIVLTKDDGIKPYGLAKIYIEKGKIIHESISKYFSLNGAQKQYILALGGDWNGEDSIDNYC